MASKAPRATCNKNIPHQPPQTTGLAQDGPYPLSKRQREDAWSFLDLPGEVQNAIYLAVLSSSGGAVLTSELRLAMPSGLSRVSKQIHAQMCGQAMYCVRAEVNNFNFAKVITFLNRLSEADVRLLKPREEKLRSGNEQSQQTRLVIHLRFGFRDSRNTRSNLVRWLNRFNKANKRGSDIAFEYVGQCSDIVEHWKIQTSLDGSRIPFQTEQKLQHMRQIRDALILNWQNEHAALTSSVQQRAALCTGGQCQCKICVLNRCWQYAPCKRYRLGSEWVEVQDLQA